MARHTQTILTITRKRARKDDDVDEAPAKPSQSKRPRSSTADAAPPSSLQSRIDTWKQLYSRTLPAAAKARSPAQPRWPVTLDHCFARIILDNAVGRTAPWTSVLKAPAYKHMTAEQLDAAIRLGNDVLDGEADLVELDEHSLRLRGKASKRSVK